LRQLRARSLLVLAASIVALGAGATTARSADSQLLDVSRQVTEIQRRMAKLLETGKAADQRKLDLVAACGQLPQPSQVFRRWGDFADYALAPQGDLTESSSWTLGVNTAVVAEHDPYTPGTRSLRLLAGGQAATPVICVNQLHPTIRFFARSNGSAASTLNVEVLYQDVNGRIASLRIARLRAMPWWAPTIVVPYYVNALAALSPEGVTAVAFRFRAEGVAAASGGWTIGSLYVDPFVSR